MGLSGTRFQTSFGGSNTTLSESSPEQLVCGPLRQVQRILGHPRSGWREASAVRVRIAGILDPEVSVNDPVCCIRGGPGAESPPRRIELWRTIAEVIAAVGAEAVAPCVDNEVLAPDSRGDIVAIGYLVRGRLEVRNVEGEPVSPIDAHRLQALRYLCRSLPVSRINIHDDARLGLQDVYGIGN
jgi:hypothetical protein